MNEFNHIPVMLNECIQALKLKKGAVVVDATIGGAGHSTEIIKHIADGRLVGLDRDTEALAESKKRLKNTDGVKNGVEILLIKCNFADIADTLKAAGIEKVDAVLADFGVSSYQIDNPNRGFSYMNDGELDMRMDTEHGHTAGDIVNSYPEKKLAEIIYNYGEERYANRIASSIVANRPITRTVQLAEIIKNAVPSGYGKTGGHPAKRTFQAIRIAVNNELDSIEKFLTGALSVLKVGGRLAVITFHSLEDRIVKQKFKLESSDCICDKNFPQCVCGHTASIKLINKKPITPSDDEVRQNPRSGSAKLRVAEKITAEKTNKTAEKTAAGKTNITAEKTVTENTITKNKAAAKIKGGRK
jgi:16S rRNA (cytosine1402-N4)-methyltransferase